MCVQRDHRQQRVRVQLITRCDLRVSILIGRLISRSTELDNITDLQPQPTGRS